MNRTSLRSNDAQHAQNGEMRIAKIALVNIALWVAMWTPYAAIVMQGAVGNQDIITPFVTTVPALIAKTASIANPVIYAISHPKYRLVRQLIRFIETRELNAHIVLKALKKAVPWLCIQERSPPLIYMKSSMNIIPAAAIQ